MGKSIWHQLAEAVGIKVEAGWDAVAKKRNMQRYGSTDRRNKQGPLQYFNTKGTGAAQRQDTMANTAPNMTPKKGGLQIPSGFGGPKAPSGSNPLYDPPTPKRNSIMGLSGGSPQALQANPVAQTGADVGPDDGHEDWLDMLSGDGGDEPEGAESDPRNNPGGRR